MKISKDHLLSIFMSQEPSARSNYAITGHRPMWFVAEYPEHDAQLFACPSRVMVRRHPTMEWSDFIEVDGVAFQWQRDGEWIGQGFSMDFDSFEKSGPATHSSVLPQRDFFFDWGKRTSDTVLWLPFSEKTPDQFKASMLNRWWGDRRSSAVSTLVRLYHATDARLPIEEEGLKPTSASRRRSLQSQSGFVYLANTPERAKWFGDMGNQGRSVVYEVVVRTRDFAADKDQLFNLRSTGVSVGDSVGESVAYGGGIRVRGGIQPWAVRKLDYEKERLLIKAKMAKAELLQAGCTLLMSKLPDIYRKDVVIREFSAYVKNHAKTLCAYSVASLPWPELEQSFAAHAVRTLGLPADQVSRSLSLVSPCSGFGVYALGATQLAPENEADCLEASGPGL